MFGLTFRERITNLMEKAYTDEEHTFEEAFLAQYISRKEKSNEPIAEDEWQTLLFQCTNEYIDAVSEAVLSFTDGISPQTRARKALAFVTPSLAGLPGLDELEDEAPIPAGFIYGIAYYAVTGKQAKPKDCVLHNHLFHKHIDSVLARIAAEHPEIQ